MPERKCPIKCFGLFCFFLLFLFLRPEDFHTSRLPLVHDLHHVEQRGMIEITPRTRNPTRQSRPLPIGGARPTVTRAMPLSMSPPYLCQCCSSHRTPGPFQTSTQSRNFSAFESRRRCPYVNAISRGNRPLLPLALCAGPNECLLPLTSTPGCKAAAGLTCTHLCGKNRDKIVDSRQRIKINNSKEV